MNEVLANSLYEKQRKRFEKLQDHSRKFGAIYSGNTIIRDNIFGVMENYARKNEMELELLRYPMRDNELWALTFIKQGVVFVCVNSELELCKQFFAAAHELYHIYCYEECTDQSYVRNGSMLDSETANENGKTQEDLEANAFAGLLLMPDDLISEQMALFGIQKENIDIDAVLSLMEMFAIPFKAVVLRLYESGCIDRQRADSLLKIKFSDVAERIALTGRAKRWQLDGHGTEMFGSLFEKVEYNSAHEYLTDSREKEDREYISELKKKYNMN